MGDQRPDINSVAFLIDFGSTFTKVTAVDLSTSAVIGRSQSPSTVLTDVREGLIRALIELHDRTALFTRRPADLEVLQGKLVFASSSAAGGLRMVVIGLVPGLTVEAANLAALGAGAKVVGSSAFKLDEKKIQEIVGLRPDMLLLTGGTDGGDSGTILHNTRLLAASKLDVPIVIAGNQAVAGEVSEILRGGGKEIRCAKNVLPQPGKLAVESTREEIRKLFMERITHAKGLDQIKEVVSVILPTPMAVLQGVLRGAEGTEVEEGWGEMLVVDVGGATTDVHSVGYGEPSGPNPIVQSLPEPFAKRTVEGDLGIRYNAATLLGRVGLNNLASELHTRFPAFSVSREDLSRYIEEISQETARIPRDKWQGAADAVLARVAVDLAVERHVGKREKIYSREGEVWLHHGKDLLETSTLIGTGGVFVHNPFAAHILGGNRQNERWEVLRPKNPRLFIDSSYLLYAVGLLAESHPTVAVRIFREHMTPVKFQTDAS